MDQYENQFPEQEDQLPEQENQETNQSAPVQPPQQAYEEPAYQPPQYAKKSPYVDSPYVMNHIYEQPKTAPRKKSNGGWKKALCVILAVVLVAGSCLGTALVLNAQWENRMEVLTKRFESKIDALEEKLGTSGAPSVTVPGSTVVPTGDLLTPAQVYAANVQTVVMIQNRITTNIYGQSASGTSTGSGFILTADGYVVTNYHVVEGEGKISVITWDNKEHPAKLIGFDKANDVALLKVEAEGLQAVTLGSSESLVVGDQVVAIGNPLGELTATQTVGYVSAKERDITTDGFAINMIQTDAAINSGNSGGPLFNMRGEVVGITTAKYSGTSSSGASIEGIGFAIPIDDVSGMLSDLANLGYVTGAYLGVSVSDMDASAADYYNMPVGAYVVEVVEGNCAHAAGVQVKDIIVDIGGYTVTNVNSLGRVLRNFRGGDETTITVYRGGKELILPIILDEKPGTSQVEKEPETQLPENMPESGDFEEWYKFFEDFFGDKG